MKYRFTPTPEILRLCTDIAVLLGRFEGLSFPTPQPRLRRENRLRAIRGTLAIEGNTVSLEQVADIVDRKPVYGPSREILETHNAVKAYGQRSSIKLYSLSSLRKFHKILMQGVMADPGRFRTGRAGITRKNRVVFVAPAPKQIPARLRDLLSFLKDEKAAHALIRACVFHYEFEFIHPFEDGNGRLGRLWQTAFLAAYHPAFESAPIESIVKKEQSGYYRALRASDKAKESTPFVGFSLQTMHTALTQYLEQIRPAPETPAQRIRKARSIFRRDTFCRKQYMSIFKKLSTATASRDLGLGVKSGLLTKSGDKALTVYRYIKF